MVKGLLLTPERTYRRKIREMILARNIERHFTKQEILYLYLNQIYFGHGAYGIGEAAETYFGKDVSELSVSEGAQLAGLPKAPSRYSPYANPEAAEQRRRYVLDRMLEEKLIDASAHAAAIDRAAAAARAHRCRPGLGDGVLHRAGAPAPGRRARQRRRAARRPGDRDHARRRAAARAPSRRVRRGLVELDQRQAYRGPLRKVAPAAIDGGAGAAAPRRTGLAATPAGRRSHRAGYR